MAFNVQKTIKDNAEELQNFLRDLKDWEKTMKEKDASLKNASQSQQKLPPVRGRAELKPAEPGLGKAGNEPSRVWDKETRTQPSPGKDQLPHAAAHTYDKYKSKWDKFDVDAALKEMDEDVQNESKTKITGISSNKKVIPSSSISSLSGQTVPRPRPATLDSFSSALTEEPPPDAVSEKELGNEFFKQKKFIQAVECYSRSIALQPTAVAYANRAMAFLKIRRFEEAEADCTEAISLDDRYTKAYSRRGTARRELKKYLEAVEDHEFALRLEPQSKELQSQYSETKSLFEKQSNQKLSEEKVPLVIRKATQEAVEPSASIHAPSSANLSSASFQGGEAVVSKSSLQSTADILADNMKTKVESQNNRKQEIAASIQAAAARAAAVAITSVSRNLVAPKTSYEFETTWKGLSGDRSSQVRLLKIMDPQAIPKLFKDSLGAILLVDIIQTLGLLFSEDPNLAIQFLENLTRVGRFNMTIMFLTPKDKAALKKLWDEVFTAGPIPIETLEHLNILRGKYHL